MLFAALTTLAVATLANAALSSLARRVNRGVVEGPFSLQIESLNKPSAVDGKYVVGVHVGAAINIAVPSDSKISTYYVNGTNGYKESNVQYGTLDYDVAPGIPYKGGLLTNTSSNLAALYLSVLPSENSFSTAEDGRLLLGGLSKWYSCTTPTAYGPKIAINWLLGDGAPSTADCEPVFIRIAA